VPGVRYPLLRVTLAGLRAHAARLALTAAAVMIGVGFLAGAMVYGDTARSAFYQDMARAARNVDTVVRPAGFDGAARVPPELVDRLRAVPGVAEVDGRATETLSMLDRGGKLITNFGQVGYGLSVPAEPALSRYGVAGGRLPGRPGEIAVDRGTVTTAGFQVGQPVRVLDRGGRPHDLTLVGVLDLGVNRLFAGQSVAALEAGQLAELTSGRPLRFTEVVVAARPGVDQAALRDRVDRALAGDGSWAGDRFWVSTGEEYRRELAERAANYVDGFLRVLIGFGLVAVTVSGFVIYNTFAILAAQRRRELALLRCVGASRRQVFGTVIGESLALGVVASLGGLLLSLLIGYGLILGRELVGAVIPAHTPVLGWRTVAVAAGFGTVVTVASALVPATAASRVAPLAALRTAELTDAPLSRRAAGRLVVAVAVGGSGTAVALAGYRAGFPGLPLVLGGAMLGFLAIVAVSPLVVGRFTGAVGWLPARIFGAPARLAAVNARRNPRRVAATTTALMIGVALMSMLSVLLATARTQAGQELTENFPVEFVLQPADGEQFRAWGERFAGTDGIPDEVVAALRGRPEFAAVAEVRAARSYVDGRRAEVWAVSPEGFRGPVVPEVTAGDLAGLGPGAVALRRTLAWDVGVRVGDRIDLDGFGEQTVVALYDDAATDDDVLVPWGTAGLSARTSEVLVDVVDTVPAAQARQALDAALRDHPLVRVDSLAERRGDLSTSLDELLGIFAALLGMAVVIAMFGIGNTLSLSVFERTRESATLRALGLSRRQLRGMFLVEAALMAVLGSLAGVAFGVTVGWTAALGLIDAYGHGAPTVPVGQLLLYVGLATAAALLAGLLPARQATRTEIIAALSR
jgi:putative ABC transport system permease protein